MHDFSRRQQKSYMPSTRRRLSDVAELTPEELMLRKRTRQVGSALCINMSAARIIANKVILQRKEQRSTCRKAQSLANACRSIHQLDQRHTQEQEAY